MAKGISAVILAKNEEKRIIPCLESVKGWIDEIIVIDDMSIDRTPQICREYGAKVIIQPLNNDFGRQRNFGIREARNNWILSLDADFVVTQELKEEIEKILEDPKEFVAFECRLKTNFLGHFIRYAGAFDTWKVILFRKDKAYFESRVHERLTIKGPVGRLKGAIEHFGFQSITQFINVQNLYTSLMAEEYLKEKGIIPEKEISYNIKIRPWKLFWKLYIKKMGYRDGMPGLVWCILNTISPTLFWIKYWELVKRKT